MKELYVEGVATHDGSEPCACGREALVHGGGANLTPMLLGDSPRDAAVRIEGCDPPVPMPVELKRRTFAVMSENSRHLVAGVGECSGTPAGAERDC